MKPRLAPALFLHQAGAELFRRGEWPRTELATCIAEAMASTWYDVGAVAWLWR